MNPDEALQAQALAGDPDAFGSLIRAWDSDLRGVAWSIVRSATDTDDIMQATYEKAFRSLDDFRGHASMKTWLHAICYRTAIDHERREHRRRHDNDDHLVHTASSDSTSDLALQRTELAAVLEQLDIEQRSLLMLVAGLGYSFDEAAQISGLPRGTVASKVGRARMILRRYDAQSGDGR